MHKKTLGFLLFGFLVCARVCVCVCVWHLFFTFTGRTRDGNWPEMNRTHERDSKKRVAKDIGRLWLMWLAWPLLWVGRSEWLCWQKSLNVTPRFLGETEGHSWQDQGACYHGGHWAQKKRKTLGSESWRTGWPCFPAQLPWLRERSPVFRYQLPHSCPQQVPAQGKPWPRTLGLAYWKTTLCYGLGWAKVGSEGENAEPKRDWGCPHGPLEV